MFYSAHFLCRSVWVQDWGDDFLFLLRIMGMGMKFIVTPRNEVFGGRVRAESDTKEM